MSSYIKFFSFLWILLLSTFISFGQSVTEVHASLHHVEVYSYGATMHHTARQVSLPVGNSEIVINQVAQQVDVQSIRINSDKAGVTILSVTFERDYLSKGGNESTQYLDAKRRYMEANTLLKKMTSEREGEESILKLLEENRKFGGQNGVTPTTLTAMINYYREQHQKISQNILELKDKEEEQKKVVSKLEKQMLEAGGEDQNAGQLLVRIHADQPVQADFSISYFTNHVSWTPFYEMRVINLNQPIQLIYKANISQKTGIDWKAVLLTFASGNPRQNNNAPLLHPWQIGFAKPLMLKGRAPIGEAQASSDMMVSRLSSVVSNQDMAVTESNQLRNSFVIHTPYDVYSNSKPQSVQLQSYTLSAQYSYFSAPRSDEAAFLIGKITDWGKLNLLPGHANLIVDNNYAGTSYIDPHSTSDTLVLSLGRDDRIVTKREEIHQEGSTSFLGNSQSRIYTYEISVRNNRREDIDIEIKEQFPISIEKDIEIKLLEVSGAHVNQTKGELTWNIPLAVGDSKKFKVSYSVKSPKNKVISGL